MDRETATIYHFPMSSREVTAVRTPSDEAGSTPVAESRDLVSPPGRGFVKRRDLTLEEAASVAGIRWLQYDADRLDTECTSLREEVAELRSKVWDLTTQYHDNRGEVEAPKGRTD